MATVLISAALTVLATSSGAPADSAATCLGERATIVGTEGDDLIAGTSKDDVIVALGGNDVINAHGGDDLVCALGGNDLSRGASADDIINVAAITALQAAGLAGANACGSPGENES